MSTSPAFGGWWGGIDGGAERERWRAAASRGVAGGRSTWSAAARCGAAVGRSECQVWRLLKAFRSDGVAGLISKKRGRPSTRRTAAAVRAAALWIVRHNYADFGPTLAAE
jgi:hypothetical protein